MFKQKSSQPTREPCQQKARIGLFLSHGGGSAMDENRQVSSHVAVALATVLLAQASVGYAATPTLAADINSGANSSIPEYLTVYNGKLYFQAYNGTNGGELWVYDGSSAQMVADIRSGVSNSYPKYLTVYNNKLYFSANNGTNGYELWVYDGSSAQMAADINGSSDSYPGPFTVYNGKLYFSADNGTNGKELWVYDGSSAPSMVADINSGASHSSPAYLTVYNGKLYFSAYTETNGGELWVYDGSSAPSMVADIYSGNNSLYPNSSYPKYLTVYNNKLYFQVRNETSGEELWVY